jgi:hypothetical protein
VSKDFKIAYVVERGKIYNDSAITQYADEVVFLLIGNEQDGEIERKLRKSLLTFDPENDVIITNGRLLSSFILGLILSDLPYFYLGIYRNKDYTFKRIDLETTFDGTFV